MTGEQWSLRPSRQPAAGVAQISPNALERPQLPQQSPVWCFATHSPEVGPGGALRALPLASSLPTRSGISNEGRTTAFAFTYLVCGVLLLPQEQCRGRASGDATGNGGDEICKHQRAERDRQN